MRKILQKKQDHVSNPNCSETCSLRAGGSRYRYESLWPQQIKIGLTVLEDSRLHELSEMITAEDCRVELFYNEIGSATLVRKKAFDLLPKMVTMSESRKPLAVTVIVQKTMNPKCFNGDCIDEIATR